MQPILAETIVWARACQRLPEYFDKAIAQPGKRAAEQEHTRLDRVADRWIDMHYKMEKRAEAAEAAKTKPTG